MKEGNKKMSEKVKIPTKNLDIKRDNSASQTQKTDFPHSTNFVADQILFLQRTIGNQAVQRLLKSGVIQTKLRIDQPGDKYGQETDWGADTIMRMLNPQFQRESEKKVKPTEVSTAWKKGTAQSQKSFRDRNNHLGKDLDLIEKAMASVTKDNIPLAQAFFSYYSDHEIIKIPTKEFQEKAKAKEERSKQKSHKSPQRKELCIITITGNVECDESIFKPEFPIKTLGTVLIHELVHTHHPRVTYGQHGYLEGEAYGVEMFLAQRVGATKRINQISDIALKQTKDWYKEFQVAFFTMKLLYRRIDNKEVHEFAPQELRTLKPDDARKIVAEFVSKGAKDTKNEILKTIEYWVRRDPSRVGGLFKQ